MADASSLFSAPIFCVKCKQEMQVGQLFCPLCGVDQRRPAKSSEQDEFTAKSRVSPLSPLTVGELLACPTCEQLISINALSCPVCGQPMKSSPSALTTAKGVVCGLLLVIGLLIFFLGAYGVVTRNSPSEDVASEIAATRASGEYVDHSIETAKQDIGVAESDNKLRLAIETGAAGAMLMLPFGILVFTKNKNRR